MTKQKVIQAKESISTDVLIIGSGAAGLMTALKLGKHHKITMLSRYQPEEGSTFYAQGGIACVWSKRDSFESHIQDSIYAGDGLCDEKAVKVLVEQGPDVVQDLLTNVSFDRNEKGDIILGHEGAHSHRRILHSGGDATGKAIQQGLLKRVGKLKNIQHLSNHRAVQLIVNQGRCRGAMVWNKSKRSYIQIQAKAVVIASGGYSRLFQETTNPRSSTGDGVYLALKAGAVIRDPEFAQFHPTALFLAGAPRFLITEAARGEGGILRNASGDAFMKDVHSMGELAPRDVVSRAIVREMIKTGESCAFLDMSHLKSNDLKKRFPTIYKVCESFHIDLEKQWIPIRPAAHYTMGGIETNTHGQSSIPGLYACGETASTGVHGANRLASNSLLEALVFGKRCAQHLEQSLSKVKSKKKLDLIDIPRETRDFDFEDMIRTVQSLMWRTAGVFRDETSMIKTQKRIDKWLELDIHLAKDVNLSMNFQSHLSLAKLVLQGAIERRESRGAHHRLDYPRRNDKKFKKHTRLTLKDINQSVNL